MPSRAEDYIVGDNIPTGFFVKCSTFTNCSFKFLANSMFFGVSWLEKSPSAIGVSSNLRNI